ncbi:NAD(P)-dependent alcohol dehydrogenase [Nocardia speluncae]|uniref:alcohol dehydrogenase n=1 Tax=Nocardia speluncae TaxID=419477 RepID=A0A846XGL8_9NOCA|nr:NAD(P)-dependent alcohol dehydrogenase [Nocardia speluncae]NKY33743.1 NAD(P)-dependent alcohol dehydrogenase [Nocardia speluncae]
MRALQLTEPGRLEIRDVPIPEPGPGELLIRVGASGICHSDLHVLHLPFKVRDEPLILGHEIAGTIAALGDRAEGHTTGERGIVYLCWSCGKCPECASGNENVCRAAGRVAMPPCPGLGPDGGMAEYVAVPAGSFVPIGDMDFVAAAPLADAALTSYHAIRGARDQLYPGSTAVVIGAGGLGHVGIQILRALTATRIVAVDTDPDKRDLAVECGAHEVLAATADTADRILELTGGRGAEAVFDFVGVDATAQLAVRSVGPNGAYRMIGLGDGDPGITAGPAGGPGLPWGATVRKSYGGTKRDLIDSVALARAGSIEVRTQQFALEDGANAYVLLEQGRIRGRAVLVP